MVRALPGRRWLGAMLAVAASSLAFAALIDTLDEIDLSRVAFLGLWNPSDRAGTLLRCEVFVDDIHFE
ncbi:MAG: hypothetical protein OEQ13_01875 [Acidobacteriota bacterium]|nr:hypothetical protein [Acidobacteriota bacterium]